jgi:hypothetical protein
MDQVQQWANENEGWVGLIGVVLAVVLAAAPWLLRILGGLFGLWPRLQPFLSGWGVLVSWSGFMAATLVGQIVWPDVGESVGLPATPLYPGLAIIATGGALIALQRRVLTLERLLSETSRSGGVQGSREPVTLTLGGFRWDGPAGGGDEVQLTAALAQVGVTNNSDARLSVPMFRLDIEGFPSFYPSDVDEDAAGHTALKPVDGGWARVVRREKWLSLPIQLEPGESVVGWLGFVLRPGQGRLILRSHVRVAPARIAAMVAGHGEVTATAPLYGAMA